MIKGFKCKETQTLYETGKTREWPAVAKVAMRKLGALAAATALQDLQSPPGNKLEKLSGDRAGQHSIRINDQWRVCFIWTDDGPTAIEIIDYH